MTLTFPLTDVEGSTRLWEAHREAMGRALAPVRAPARDRPWRADAAVGRCWPSWSATSFRTGPRFAILGGIA
jgi:hypothetical protein